MSLFDERGRELLGRWLNGSGKPLITKNGVWGDYLFANELLREQIMEQLKLDAGDRTESGWMSVKFHAEIENGYNTGYEMLHGTDSRVGDFLIQGKVTVSSKYNIYNITLTWNDTIDPNGTYSEDKVLSGWLRHLYNPKDYVVHLSWTERVKIEK